MQESSSSTSSQVQAINTALSMPLSSSPALCGVADWLDAPAWAARVGQVRLLGCRCHVLWECGQARRHSHSNANDYIEATFLLDQFLLHLSVCAPIM